jgi:hypothetical protein
MSIIRSSTLNLKNALLSSILVGMTSNFTLALASGKHVLNGDVTGQTGQLETSAEALSAEEEADILFMREEEKLARDVYIFLYDQWANAVFDNISASEQRHMDSMAVLVNTYGLTDPVQDSRVGAFTNPDLATLFTTLTVRGQVSQLEALRVGAFIEEVDMRDIQAAIDNSDHADINQTYENLLRGSRNHLRAFVRTIENLGVVYEAQVLPQSEVDAIVDSPIERGGS